MKNKNKNNRDDDFGDEKEEHSFNFMEEEETVVNSKENKIYILGSINIESAFRTMVILNEIYDELEDSKKFKIPLNYNDIEIHLNSEGGIVYDALALYDLIKKVSKKYTVKVFCTGKIMSAAFLILSAGTKGFKLAGRNTTFMLHQVQTQTIGNQSDSENELKESRRLQNLYISILSKESNSSKKDLTDMINSGQNIYFTTNKAIQMGFIDSIL